ncbi:hypothetical protein BJX63DRAFT_38042 [Aspergillus granulosus]|uniref:Uncharacterized protein n=1 Tax=Aspergillus granulosus TaxID=176169 RepID=A0ABR4GYX9_9EURO
MPTGWQQINGPCQLVECNAAGLGNNERCYLSGQCPPSLAVSKLVEILGREDDESVGLASHLESNWSNSLVHEAKVACRRRAHVQLHSLIRVQCSAVPPSGLPRRIWKFNSRWGGAR